MLNGVGLRFCLMASYLDFKALSFGVASLE